MSGRTAGDTGAHEDFGGVIGRTVADSTPPFGRSMTFGNRLKMTTRNGAGVLLIRNLRVEGAIATG